MDTKEKEYCLIVWRGDNRYRVADALAWYSRESDADKAAAKRISENVVVRSRKYMLPN